MCWAVPVQIQSIEGNVGTVNLSGTTRQVGLALVENPQVGDYVLVHAGFAIQKIDEQEAQETLKLFDEMFAAQPDGGRGEE